MLLFEESRISIHQRKLHGRGLTRSQTIFEPLSKLVRVIKLAFVDLEWVLFFSI